ncbi:MAG: extracellular solute-binding protein [Lachnospiraceae bacterium]
MRENISSGEARIRKTICRTFIYLFAVIVAAAAFYPFFVMIISSTHDNYNIVAKINVLPGSHFNENFARLTQNIDLAKGIGNSLFLALTVTVVQNYFIMMAAYAFSKFDFKGKHLLFSVVMVAMMLPGQLGIIGFYKEIQAMHLLNNYLALIIPTISNCFAVFFYKQFIDGALPNELIEAAVMDGCGELKIFHRIVLPLVVPALVTQGVPDVFDLEENYMYEFLDSDIIADLSYMNFEELTKDYFDFQIASMKDSDGRFKTLSFQSSPVCFWYLRDAAEEWLGTSDPAEISAMLGDWETVIAKGEEIYEKSNSEVSLWPNITEMVKVDAFSFDPLVKDGKLVISDDWMGLLDNMRTMYESKANAELGSWGSDWAAAWNDGKLIFRVMPSWDFFTDWEKNAGNVGVATPFRASYEGATGICVYDKTDKKDLAAKFLAYVASYDFQKINADSYNQVPASKAVCDALAESSSSEDFGGQNLMATYSEICNKVVGITPDKYTRSVQNLFQKWATDGIKAGKDNAGVIEDFKKALHDQYPEVVID